MSVNAPAKWYARSGCQILSVHERWTDKKYPQCRVYHSSKCTKKGIEKWNRKMEQKKEWNQKSKRIPVSIDNVAVFIELVRVSEFQFYVAFFTMESSIFESRPKTWESNFNPLTLAAFRAHCINSTDMFFTHGLFSFFHFEFWDERRLCPLSFEI